MSTLRDRLKECLARGLPGIPALFVFRSRRGDRSRRNPLPMARPGRQGRPCKLPREMKNASGLTFPEALGANSSRGLSRSTPMSRGPRAPCSHLG